MHAVADYLHDNPGIGLEPHLYPISVAAYHRMGEVGILSPTDRTELIDARIISMSPIGSEHADWVDRLARFFIRALPEDITVRPQNPVYLDEVNEPEPDTALLRPRAIPYRHAHPSAEDVLLVVEVADTSLGYDRRVKVSLYARHGFPEVWIIDARSNRLEVYREPRNGEYGMLLKLRKGKKVSLFALPEVTLDLRKLLIL